MNKQKAVEISIDVYNSWKAGSDLGGSKDFFEGVGNTFGLVSTLLSASPGAQLTNLMWQGANIAKTSGQGNTTSKDVLSAAAAIVGTAAAIGLLVGASPLTATAAALIGLGLSLDKTAEFLQETADWYSDPKNIKDLKGKLKSEFSNASEIIDSICADAMDFKDKVLGAVGDAYIWAREAAEESFDYLLRYLDPLGINADVNTSFKLALKTASPIVLDLDGDGIETFGANGQVVFDHDGDSLKDGTGWLKSDDGLLVLDRNDNGTVDSGLELFGENTLLAEGSKAKDGFAAMQAVDENGDGKLDASDGVWADLRVWRDLNGDGISESGELFTLEELGIKSIGTGSDGKTRNLGNNNHIDGFGTFEWEAGGTGVSGDVYFEDNPFYREFGDTIEIPAELAGIATMQGSGAVRDLREAAATNASLRGALANYSQAGSRTEQLALLGGLIHAWAGSADFRMFDERVEDLGNGKAYTVKFSYSWDMQDRISVPVGGSGAANGGTTTGIPVDLDSVSAPTAAQLKTKELLEMVRVLEVFNSQYFFEFQSATQNEKSGVVLASYKAGAQVRSGSGIVVGGTVYLTEEDFSFGAQQEANIRKSYQALLDSVYDGLLLQTRLKPYMDAVTLSFGKSGIAVDFSGALKTFTEVHAVDPVKAIVDLSEFASSAAGRHGWATGEISILGEWVRQLDSAQLDALRQQLGSELKVIIDTEAGTNLQGVGLSDFLFGEAGNDTLYGYAGADFLEGGEGNDRLYGGDGNDILYGGAGNDYLSGGSGNDILEGGSGNDSLSGDAGSDVYRFARGWGQDTVNNYDTGTGKVDAIEFAADIAPSDIRVRRSGSQLELSLVGTTDRIAVSSFFQNDGAYKLDEVRFADGTVWNVEQLKTLALQSTDGNDTLQGYASDDSLTGGLGNDSLLGGAGHDRLSGGEGNDSLYGETGDDLLSGGIGNDSLYGGAGNDTLEGGTGNDSLSGDSGSDLYRFARGWGQDTVNNYDTGTGKVDAIEFAADIAPSDIRVRRSGSQLELSLVGTTDRISVSSFFQNDGASAYRLDEVRFADGTVWNVEQLKALALQSTDGNDTLQGYASDDSLAGGLGHDSLSGGAGHDSLLGEGGNDYLSGEGGTDLLLGGEGTDTLYGGAGNDILEGGSGNDSLSGDAGSDVYRFARGWGQDTVNNYDTGTGKVDAIEFAADIAPSDIRVRRSGSQLELSLMGTTDRISVSSFFHNDGASGYKLDEVRFADGTVWNVEQLKALALQSTDGNDTLQGYASDDSLTGGLGNDSLLGGAGHDRLSGGEGNDSLYGETGDDLLSGGIGNDSLYGGAGNDTLEGGTGNDSLSGDSGSDVYRFARGWGQDTINNYDAGTNKVDAIEFAADIAPGDIRVRRSGSQLELSLEGTSDRIAVSSFFQNDGASAYKLDEVRFADGTVWNVEQLKVLVLQGGDDNDSMQGFASDDRLSGGAGNDYLYGEGGNDLLLGGSGSDSLYGGSGNDVLDGGAGNDYLSGGTGSDTYVLRKGGLSVILCSGITCV